MEIIYGNYIWKLYIVECHRTIFDQGFGAHGLHGLHGFVGLKGCERNSFRAFSQNLSMEPMAFSKANLHGAHYNFPKTTHVKNKRHNPGFNK
jgi:hypothetical protein